MAIGHIMLPLTGGSENANVAAYGMLLAKQLSAHVSGCYEEDLEMVFGSPVDMAIPPAGYNIMFEAKKMRREREKTAHDQFDVAARVAGLSLGPESAPECATWLPTAADKVCAFDILTDLVVTALPGVAGPPVAWTVIDHVLFTAQRLLLGVPAASQQHVFQRPLIAWNGSREAQNAVERSLQLLKPGARIAIAQCGNIRSGRMPLRRLAEYLHCHGFSPIEEDMEGRVGAIEDAIFEQAQAQHCDCIIMGAYTHSRARELLLGGVTDYMLRHSHIPLLMSH